MREVPSHASLLKDTSKSNAEERTRPICAGARKGRPFPPPPPSPSRPLKGTKASSNAPARLTEGNVGVGRWGRRRDYCERGPPPRACARVHTSHFQSPGRAPRSPPSRRHAHAPDLGGGVAEGKGWRRRGSLLSILLSYLEKFLERRIERESGGWGESLIEEMTAEKTQSTGHGLGLSQRPTAQPYPGRTSAHGGDRERA